MRVLLNGVGTLIGAMLVACLFLLVNGGVTYRIQCANGDGSVSSHWTYEWATPIPYLLSPTRTGCEVHSGTRVLLSRIGIDRIPRETAGGIAIATSSNEYDAYYARIFDVANTFASAARSGDGSATEQALSSGMSRLRDISPPSGIGAQDARFKTLFTKLAGDFGSVQSGLVGRSKVAPLLAADLRALANAMTQIQKTVVALR